MGIFSRQSDTDNSDEDFSHVELPSEKDLNTSFLDASDYSAAAPRERAKKKPEYDIEKAIELMNSLPQGDPQLVVTVVQHTLESTGVDIKDIIQDGDAKEKRLNEQHKALRENIQQLEAQIADKNQKIKVLLEDLKITSQVKQQLLLTQKSPPPKTDTTHAPSSSAAKSETATAVEPTSTEIKASSKTPPTSKPMH